MPTPEQILAAADADLAKYGQLEDTLAERVRAGDDSVEPEQLEQARGMKRWAELRREGAEVKAQRLREKQAAAQSKKFIDEHLPAARGLDEVLAPLVEEAQAAIRRAFLVAEQHNEHIFRLIGHAAVSDDVVGSAALRDTAWVEVRGERLEVRTAGAVVSRVLGPLLPFIDREGMHGALHDVL